MDELSEGMQAAATAFAEEDAPAPQQAPTPQVEGAEAEVPAEPGGEEAAAEGEEVSPVQKKFVELNAEQQKAFNAEFKARKQAEKQNHEYLQRIQALEQRVNQPPAAPAQNGNDFNEAKPLLSQFDDPEKWADARDEWNERRLSHKLRQELVLERQQESAAQTFSKKQSEWTSFVDGRITEGQRQFKDFDDVCADLAPFTPAGSIAHRTLVNLKNFPEVAMQLGKNLPEADRIARLGPEDTIYELKALDHRITAQRELKEKEKQKLPTRVETPGQGEPPRSAGASASKLRRAVLESDGGKKAFKNVADYFEATE